MQNIFDTSSGEVQDNMTRDVMMMVKQEVCVIITLDEARWIARHILAGKEEGDSLYRVSTATLIGLTNRVRRLPTSVIRHP